MVDIDSYLQYVSLALEDFVGDMMSLFAVGRDIASKVPKKCRVQKRHPATPLMVDQIPTRGGCGF